MNELPEPIAQGNLRRTPFAHALLYCHEHALAGTLVIWPENPETVRGQDRIRFEEGVPAGGRLRERKETFDRGLLPLFGRTEGAYAFYDADLVGTGDAVENARLDPYRLLAASLRGPSREDAIESVLTGFGASPVRLRARFDLARFDLQPKESAFIDVIRAAPLSLLELAPMCELGEARGKRLLYLLAITKCLEPHSGASQSSSTSRSSVPPSTPRVSSSPPNAAAHTSTPRTRREPPPEPPPGLPFHLETQWREITSRAAEIDRQNYFEMLGVSRDANLDAIRTAYFALAKKWHPDRVPTELAKIKPIAEQIFQHLTTANKTLSDEKERGRYIGTVVDGGGTPESERQLAAILQAAMDHQKAEVMIRRRDFDGAIELLRNAVQLSPEDGDILSTLAWALFQQQPESKDIREMLSLIDQAVRQNPKSDRSHYRRGMILRRAGRETDAISALERAADLNPKNVEAVREVRIARMRAGKSSPSQRPSANTKESGLFSKLFNNKKEK
jgi:tetratricopeptide (TPR) repeat protein